MATRPTVGTATEDLYGRLGPWADEDTRQEVFQLLEMAEGIMRTLQPLEDVIRDRGDAPGWSIVLDADSAPPRWLPWLSQFAGVRLLPGLAVTDQRFRIKNTDGFKRGSVPAILAAAKQFLVGSDPTVYMYEFQGSAYNYRVATLVSETPDPAAVLAALEEQKPGGQLFTYSTIVGGDFDTLRDTHEDFNDVRDSFANFDEIVADPTQQS